MNSHRDNMDRIPGTLMGILENNSTFRSTFSELIVIFNTKTKEIIVAFKGLHFSTTYLRNILSISFINIYPLLSLRSQM